VIVVPLFFLVGHAHPRVVIDPIALPAEHNQLLLTLGLACSSRTWRWCSGRATSARCGPSYANASFVLGEALVEVPRLVAAAAPSSWRWRSSRS
jgi:hypothetical protein